MRRDDIDAALIDRRPRASKTRVSNSDSLKRGHGNTTIPRIFETRSALPVNESLFDIRDLSPEEREDIETEIGPPDPNANDFRPSGLPLRTYNPPNVPHRSTELMRQTLITKPTNPTRQGIVNFPTERTYPNPNVLKQSRVTLPICEKNAEANPNIHHRLIFQDTGTDNYIVPPNESPHCV